MGPNARHRLKISIIYITSEKFRQNFQGQASSRKQEFKWTEIAKGMQTTDRIADNPPRLDLAATASWEGAPAACSRTRKTEGTASPRRMLPSGTPPYLAAPRRPLVSTARHPFWRHRNARALKPVDPAPRSRRRSRDQRSNPTSSLPEDEIATGTTRRDCRLKQRADGSLFLSLSPFYSIRLNLIAIKLPSLGLGLTYRWCRWSSS